MAFMASSVDPTPIATADPAIMTERTGAARSIGRRAGLTIRRQGNLAVGASALPVLFLLLALAGCVESLPPPPEPRPEIAWAKARVFLPSGLRGRMEDPAVQEELAGLRGQPVLVYLHGCAGLHATARWDGARYARMGYVTILPDSLAQPGREANCRFNGATPEFGLFPRKYEFRRAEIDYAWTRLNKAAWADRRRLFLAGHSEGGAAVARYPARPGQWAGLIVTGWDCIGSLDSPTRLQADPAVPVLAINSRRDPLSRRPGRWCDTSGRPNSWTYRYDAPEHWYGKSRGWIDATAKFLSLNGGPAVPGS